jgi:SAM-dependent methyltransferase
MEIVMSDLHQMDTVSRFDDRAADYTRYRPTYPAAAIDAVLDSVGPPERVRAADIGAGTGISARLLADRGVRVIAVEPGEVMRRAAAPHQRVSWIAGKAESTGLQSATFDLVLAAQSFHWFDAPNALREFARVLKHRGRLALVWNRRSVTDPLTLGYRQAILEVGGEVAAERMPFDSAVVADSGVFAVPERRVFPNAQRLDLDGLIGRARSASYVPKAGPEGERLIALLRDVFDRYANADGRVDLVYETEVYLSRRIG